MTDLAQLATDGTAGLALQEFRRRQANARGLVEQGRLTPAEADAALRPWAAVAMAFGADPAELAPDLAALHAYWQGVHRQNWGERAPLHDLARGSTAHETFPLDDLPEIIAAARDKAIERAQHGAPEAQANARRLQIIAAHWPRVPRYQPRAVSDERKAA